MSKVLLGDVAVEHKETCKELNVLSVSDRIFSTTLRWKLVS